jgi:hypothetical protein
MTTRLLVWLLGLLSLLTAPGIAHEKGIIRLASKEVPAGGELGIRGEKLPKSATLRLELRGTLETFSLGEVRTNATGRFQARLPLPAQARAGSYTVVAVAADGDVAARATLVIFAAAAPAHAMGHGPADSPLAMTESPHPTAEMMKLTVATTGPEQAAILAIIVASFGGGLILLRGTARHRS